MKMIKINYLLLAVLALAGACKDKAEKETPNGFKFTVLKKGDGVLPKPQDILVFDFVMKDSKDSVWSDTREEGIPSAIMIADSSAQAGENGMVQMFRMLSKGDSVKATMSVKKFFNTIVGRPVPQEVDSTRDISYFIRVNDIMQMDQFREFQSGILEKKRVQQEVEDDNTIVKYLSENNIVATRDSSGIHYVIHSSKGRKKPTTNSCVTVKYTGKFMQDGQVFDQNDKIAFPLNAVIRGWQLGIPLLGIGDVATLYIPSGLAYGPQGYPGAIPPDAILIFDVELIGFGSTFDQATGACK
jgi:FKBP-type peptidyl-prolyl cis-trans isomerase FkpA